MVIGVTYNERSWAIDLIGHLKQVLSSQNRSIQDAGGEQTVKTDGGSLFPDVLLFGDKSLALILQGWELKMPDTSIDDKEFRENAIQKAIALGLDSFVLWNVSHAHLYVKQSGTTNFICSQKWDDLAHIKKRNSVQNHRAEWEALATKIINHLSDLFDRGSLEGRQFVEAYKSGGITSLVMENTDEVTSALNKNANQDAMLKAQILLWGERYKSEYGDKKASVYKVLAQANISNWIGKILFAHILQGKDSRAQSVSLINHEINPSEALEIFRELSDKCNFWTIFSDSVGLACMPDRAWKQIIELNNLLKELRIGEIEQSQLSDILEATVEVAIRKLRGQYPTPLTLARLLTELCINNATTDKVLDPCCGSGTIPRAVLEHKLAADVLPNDVALTVFAGDQDHQAIQIATFALAKPDLMDIPLRLFPQDAFSLTPETEISLRHPRTGELFTESVGKFDVIISNFPFIAQEGLKQYENAIKNVNDIFLQENPFNKKTDICAYLPFALYPMLVEGGRLGIIITNSWLSTAWGDRFFERIQDYYCLKSVITSGAGRWFQNSAVVTNILILEKRELEASDTIDYVVLTRPLEEMIEPEAISIAAAQIRLGQTHNETMTIHSVTKDKIDVFRKYGLGGNAQFVDCDWLLECPLKPLSSVFTIRRGARRGWDEMFYPSQNHSIEQEYIRPVLKSSTEIKKLVTSATSDAFSCNKTILELEELNHTGALEWIAEFESKSNGTGKALPDVLANSKMHWYEMPTDMQADLAMPMNFGDRLFIARLKPKAFLNQRLISLKARSDTTDIELCHALLNSAVSMFIIEGMGFGRGQGVLDLSKDRIEKFMHMLDYSELSANQIESIKSAFVPIAERNIMQVADELEELDRKNFDDIVIKAFGLNVSREHIYECLRNLLSIRQAATEVYDI